MKHYEFLVQRAEIERNEELDLFQQDGIFKLRRYNRVTANWEFLMQTDSEEVLIHFLRHYCKTKVKKRLNAEIPLSLHEKLKEICEQTNRPITRVLEDLITEYISKAA